MNSFQQMLQMVSVPFAINKCQWVADSQCGAREENQDNVLLMTPTGESHFLQQQQQVQQTNLSWSNNTFRLAVADGMGGHNNGRQIAEELIQILQKLPAQDDPQALRTEIVAIHQQLWEKHSQTSLKSPGTTLVMADIKTNGKTVIANIGDSRAYLWRNQQWQQLTWDQNLNEYDWRDNQLENKDDYRPNHKSHQIAQAMGYGSYGLLTNKYGHRALQLNRNLRLDLANELATNKQHPDIFNLTLQKGDALLLASDGLWSVDPQQKPLAIPAPNTLAKPVDLSNFLNKVQHNGGSDNMTAVMLWAKDT